MKPISAIVLGADQRRANVYAAYTLKFPNERKSRCDRAASGTTAR